MAAGGEPTPGTRLPGRLTVVWEQEFPRNMTVDLSGDGGYLAYVSWADRERHDTGDEVGLVSLRKARLLWKTGLQPTQHAPHPPCFEERNHGVVVSYYNRGAPSTAGEAPAERETAKGVHGGLCIYDSVGRLQKHRSDVTGVPLYAGIQGIVLGEQAEGDGYSRVVILDGGGDLKAEVKADNLGGPFRDVVVAPDGVSLLLDLYDRGLQAADMQGKLLWTFNVNLLGHHRGTMTPANPNLVAVSGVDWLPGLPETLQKSGARVDGVTLLSRQGVPLWCHGTLDFGSEKFRSASLAVDTPCPESGPQECHVGAGYGRTCLLLWVGRTRRLVVLGDTLSSTESTWVSLPDAEASYERVALSGDGRWAVVAKPLGVQSAGRRTNSLSLSIYDQHGQLAAETRLGAGSRHEETLASDLQVSNDGRMIVVVTREKTVALYNTAVDLPQYAPQEPVRALPPPTLLDSRQRGRIASPAR
jgi:hypothetical protein